MFSNKTREVPGLDEALEKAEGEATGKLLRFTGEQIGPAPEFAQRLENRLRMAAQPQQRRLPAQRQMLAGFRPVALATVAVALLVAVGLYTQLTQPRTVSAEEVLAQAQQVVKESTTAGLRNFYGNYLFRYRNGPNAPFIETRQETWFQAPDKYAYKLMTRSADGQESILSNGTDGTYSYNYIAESNQLRLSDADVSPGDPNFTGNPTTTTTITSTLQMLLFSPVSLADALELARRKTLPPLNPKSDPLPPYMYDVKLLADEAVLGRPTYVLEMTLAPGASLQLPDSQVPEKMNMWVDREMYAVLRIEGWDAQGRVLQSGVYESFQINQNSQVDILSLIVPPGADIFDLRFADEVEIDKAWQEAIERAPYQVFKPSNLPEGLTPGRPLYDTEREVVSQVYQGEVLMQVYPVYDTSEGKFRVVRPGQGQQSGVRKVTLPKLALIQGLPTSIKEEGLGANTPLQIGALTGRLYNNNGDITLIFDQGGTRMKLQSLPRSGMTREEMVQIAEAIQAIPKQ